MMFSVILDFIAEGGPMVIENPQVGRELNFWITLLIVILIFIDSSLILCFCLYCIIYVLLYLFKF